MFNTGDLGRWRNDGSLENHGRIDDQVKIKVCSTSFRDSLDLCLIVSRVLGWS